ncbi:MAG: ferritin-like domain-containing protein [Polyangiales bacterium]
MSDSPLEGTAERWAWDYVLSTSLAHKLAPPELPTTWEDAPPVRRLQAPGRPSELRVVDRAEKVRGLRSPLGRARAMHTFFHHELQAAELMAWAVLAFPDAPRELRQGLLRVALDEVRHMNMYVRAIERLGHRIGDQPVRDWFWARVPSCPDPVSFMAVMGLGFESANLEHAATFAARFREAGDEESARVQEVVGLEEIAHVRFAARWFTHFTGGLDFSVWERSLPAPLSPMLMRGSPLRREPRKRAGQPDAFLDALEAWSPGY